MMMRYGVSKQSHSYMIAAIEEAKKCVLDVPVGCVIKKQDDIIALAHNLKEENHDVTAHAEILALQKAQSVLNTTYLNDCELYVTLEPCPMCAWAIIQAGIKAIYFGAYNNQYGAIESVINLPKLANSKIKVYGGIEEEICNRILEDFFKKLR